MVILEWCDYGYFPIFYNQGYFFNNQKTNECFFKRENNLPLLIQRGLFFCAFIFIVGEVEEWNLLVWGLFWEFLLDFISTFSEKHWIYYSNCFAVLLLDHPPLNLAGNQRPIQIRISTMCIFRASQKLLCFNTQRKLLYFQFQVLYSKPTVCIDYTNGSDVGWSQFLGGKNHHWATASV